MQATFVPKSLLAVGLMAVSMAGFSANAYFKAQNGSSTGDFDDAENWYQWDSYKENEKVVKLQVV